jgi:hypothetical protein
MQRYCSLSWHAPLPCPLAWAPMAAVAAEASVYAVTLPYALFATDADGKERKCALCCETPPRLFGVAPEMFHAAAHSSGAGFVAMSHIKL